MVLRRGRLFTVSVRAGELRPVATVDAYPSGAEPAEWYDETLVEGDRVIVIGYSYRRGGTEVSLFAIDDAGGLRHLSTAHLRSNDYYSSRNYSARLVDGKLVLYTPLGFGFGGDPLASLPAMREWRPGRDSVGAAGGGFERIATPRRIYRPARSLEGSEQYAAHDHPVRRRRDQVRVRCHGGRGSVQPGVLRVAQGGVRVGRGLAVIPAGPSRRSAGVLDPVPAAARRRGAVRAYRRGDAGGSVLVSGE